MDADVRSQIEIQRKSFATSFKRALLNNNLDNNFNLFLTKNVNHNLPERVFLPCELADAFSAY